MITFIRIFKSLMMGMAFATLAGHLATLQAQEGFISTIAGTGEFGFAGDGGPAVDATLANPEAVFVGPMGHVYIADTANHRIRKVDADGTITTVAGNGLPGPPLFGDGGLATEARVSGPRGLFVDGAGNIFIAENFGIRKVDTAGIITTVAGNGAFGFSGDGGPATAASLFAPEGLYGDDVGNLYIADTGNHRLRKVDPAGIITTVAGSGQSGFFGDGGPAINADLNTPTGLVVDDLGNLYFADTLNDRVRKVEPSGIITTVAGSGARDFLGDGGPATSAALNLPRDVFVDGAGHIFIADTNNNRVRQVRFDQTAMPELLGQ